MSRDYRRSVLFLTVPCVGLQCVNVAFPVILTNILVLGKINIYACMQNYADTRSCLSGPKGLKLSYVIY